MGWRHIPLPSLVGVCLFLLFNQPDRGQRQGDSLEMLAKYDPFKVDRNGRTVLMHAVSDGNAVVTKELLDSGVDVNLSDHDGYTALMLAASNGNTLLISMLVVQGAHIHTKTEKGITALTCAVLLQNTEALIQLNMLGASINEMIRDLNLLMIAAFNGYKNVVKTLLDLGLDVNARSSSGEWSAIMLAASNGQTETVRYLAMRGADVLADDAKAWRVAMQSGHLETAALLRSLADTAFPPAAAPSVAVEQSAPPPRDEASPQPAGRRRRRRRRLPQYHPGHIL
jgi:hypothetical protein